MGNLEKKIERRRIKNLERARTNYALARELGFSSYEAGVLAQRSSVYIRELAKTRKTT